jgi:hypothetical protein
MSVPLRIEHASVVEYNVSRPLRRRRVSRGMRRIAGIGAVTALLTVLGLAGVGAVTILNNVSTAANLNPVSAVSSSSLHALAGSAHRAYGYVTVTGSVTNTGAHGTSNVQAIVELIDRENRTVQLDKAMVEAATVAAGNSAPYRVIVQDDANAVSYRLSFQHPDGRAID